MKRRIIAVDQVYIDASIMLTVLLESESSLAQ